MKRQHLVLMIFLAFAILSFSKCKGSKISPEKKRGIISWTGELAADGCDWLIHIGSESYHSDNLPAAFKIDGLKVEVVYSIKPTANDFQCSMNPSTVYKTIDIKSISKQ